MTKFNLSLKMLAVMLLVTGIALLARQTRACNSCNTHPVLMSENTVNMNNMNMNNTNMQGNNAPLPMKIPSGYALSPVSHTLVKITNNTPFVIMGDKKYYFASDQEKQEFLQNPKKYLTLQPIPPKQD